MEDSIKKMKVLYVVNARMPNERANGVQIAHTCEGIGAQGIDLTLVTRYTRDTVSVPEFFNLEDTFLHKKICAIDIEGIPFRYALRNFSFFLCANIYIFSVWCQSLFTRKKIVVFVRGEVVLSLIPLSYLMPIFFETHQIRNFETLYTWALRCMRGVVVITEGLKKKFVEAYALPADRILVARDAVDLPMFESVVPNREIWSMHGIRAGKKIVLYSGTLAHEKGVETLAEAADFLPQDIHIVFLGGTEKQVHSFKERYGQKSNISILGRVDYVEVPHYVVSADVLVLPDSAQFTYSNLYTSPMKLFEYMASRTPIVASNVPSLCEVLDSTTATLFEPDNAKSLAKAIQDTLKDTHGSKMRAESAHRAVSEFTWEKRTKAIVAHILERVHKRNK